jgi:hypothetical protein
MLYLFKLVYIYIFLSHRRLILATQAQTSIPFNNQRATILRLQGGVQYSAQKVRRDQNQHKGKLGVSIFRSGAVNEDVLVICPFTARNQWRGWQHRLARPERRTGRARKGEAIKDRQVGAPRVVLPHAGVL